MAEINKQAPPTLTMGHQGEHEVCGAFHGNLYFDFTSASATGSLRLVYADQHAQPSVKHSTCIGKRQAGMGSVGACKFILARMPDRDRTANFLFFGAGNGPTPTACLAFEAKFGNVTSYMTFLPFRLLDN